MDNQDWIEHSLLDSKKEVENKIIEQIRILRNKESRSHQIADDLFGLGFHPYSLMILCNAKKEGNSKNNEGWIKFEVDELDEIIEAKYKKYKEICNSIDNTETIDTPTVNEVRDSRNHTAIQDKENKDYTNSLKMNIKIGGTTFKRKKDSTTLLDTCIHEHDGMYHFVKDY